jgi:hypothetical protein
MIENMIEFLKNKINVYISQKAGPGNQFKILPVIPGKHNGLLITLINIEEENNLRSQKVPRGNNIPPGTCCLFLLFSADFGAGEKEYNDSLRNISYVLDFFNSQPLFTGENFPELEQSIDKIILELVNLSLNDQQQLWNTIDSGYIPSLLYKCRIISR